MSKRVKRLSEIEWDTLWMAVRYAMGRQTIASAMLPSEIVKAYYHRLTDNERVGLLRDLDRHVKDFGHFGNPRIDDDGWQRLRGALDTARHATLTVATPTYNDGTPEEHVAFRANGRWIPLASYLERPGGGTFIPNEYIIAIDGELISEEAAQ